MTSNQKISRLVAVLLPALLFCISLTQDALVYQYHGKQTHSSISIFLMGGTAILGGGMLEWLTWLANPIALLALVKFLKETSPILKIEPVLRISIPNQKPNSHWLSLFATAIAWNFSFWNEILADESGSIGKIYSLEPGYWLWVSSITFLSIGINLYYLYFNTVSTKTEAHVISSSTAGVRIIQ